MPSDKNNGLDDMNPEDEQNQKPLSDSLKILQAKYGLQQPKEDVIPYDPNSGTLTNIGRFLMNNAATDQFSGAIPVAGAVKEAEEISIPLIQRLMGKGAEEAPRLFGDTAETAARRMNADVVSDMAQGGLANATDQARAQQALSRAVDMQQRNAQGLRKIKK